MKSLAGSRKNSNQPEVRRRPPATSPEEYEKRLISLAMSQVEEQLIKKTASSQVLTHFLKLASTQAELEKEKTRMEILKMEAQTKAMESEGRLEQLYSNALEAMKSYGSSINHADEDYE